MFKYDLAQAMKDSHVSRRDLAEYLNVTKGAVDFWLDGANRPTQKRLKDICDLLDMTYEKYIKEFSQPSQKRSYTSNSDFDGDKLRKKIADKGITRKQLGAALGVTHKAVGNWCANRRPSYKCLLGLSQYFNVPLEYWSKNVHEPFTPKEQADPKVIAREKGWKNPYNRDLSIKPKGEPIGPDPIEAPIISTPIIEVKDLTKEDVEKVKEMAKEIKDVQILPKDDAVGRKVTDLIEKVELIEFDYKLQVDALNDRCDNLRDENETLAQALNGLRQLIIRYLRQDDEPETAPQEKKGFWARLFE